MPLVEQYIDCCIINGSHYDVALASVELLKEKHRYIGNNNWEYFNNIVWVPDEKQKNLKDSIRSTVCSAFIERAIFWENKSEEEPYNINLHLDNKFRSNRLLTISSKLKDDKYILTIIKECKPLLLNESI